MNITYASVDSTGWPGERTRVEARRSRWAFKAGWEDTLDKLVYELDFLRASSVVLQIELRDSDIRRDGLPRANAPQPGFPGVIVSFGSRLGPLRYWTDTYEFWQHNVRAIALGLEALRAVDRYGITHRAEQYSGWAQVGSGIAMPPAPMTREEAARIVADAAGGVGLYPLADLLRDPSTVKAAYRKAAAAYLPDAGGDAAAFDKVTQAKDLLLG